MPSTIELLFLFLFSPIGVPARTSWRVEFTSCSDVMSYISTQCFTLDGWLGAAFIAAAVHLVFRKTRLSKLAHRDTILTTTTIALFLIAPWVVAYYGELMIRYRGSYNIVETYHMMSPKGAIGVMVFAGLIAYPLNTRSAIACLVGGIVLSGGLLTALPSSDAEKPAMHHLGCVYEHEF